MNTATKISAFLGALSIAIMSGSPVSAATITPRDTISGNLTTIDDPWGVTSDLDGKIYVANSGAENVLVFAAGADGNVAPIATIQRAGTPFTSNYDVEVDSDGNIYVADDLGISVFSPGSNGTVTPDRQITGFHAYGLAVATDGTIYVTLHNNDGDYFGGDIYVFAPGASGDAVPTKVLPGDGDSVDVAVDDDGNVYLSNWANGSIDIWGPDAVTGDMPVCRIDGDSTGISDNYGIDVNCAGTTVVVSSENDNNIIEHATSSDGDVVPVNELFTSITSNGLGIGLTGDLLVANSSGAEVLVFDYEEPCHSAQSELPNTGADITPIGIGGAIALVAGGAAFIIARRRKD